MTDFCDFVPEDASCQVTPEPDTNTDGGPNGGAGKMDMDDGEMHSDDMGNGMFGNLVFLHVALGGALNAGLTLYRYRAWTYDEYEIDGAIYDWGHYESGKLADYNTSDFAAAMTNYWEYTSKAVQYWVLTTSSILFVTQALSMAGIAGEINLMAWMYLEMATAVFGLIVMLVRMYAYDAYYTASEDTDTYDSYQNASAVLALAGMETDMVMESVMGSSAHLMAAMHYKDWMHAQVMALPEEAQAKYMKKGGKKGGKKHDDKAMEKMQEVFGLFVI